MQQEINKVYTNPETGLYSATKLYHRLKDKGYSMKQIKEYLKRQETQQLHARTTKPKHYFPIYAKNENDIWQLDLMDMSQLASHNKGINFLLMCIDVHTRFLRVAPLKDKTIHSIIDVGLAHNSIHVEDRTSLTPFFIQLLDMKAIL